MKVGFFGGTFLPPHKGHEYVIHQAETRCDKLYVILFQSETMDERLCRESGVAYMPGKLRMRWLKQMTHNMKNVEVLTIKDGTVSKESYDWDEGGKRVRALLGNKIDLVFGNEKSYEKIFSRLYPEAKYVMVDEQRNTFPISSTKIRQNPILHWDYLPKPVQPFFVKKVVVVGTESCGKSTLVERLARDYETVFVEEYGRKMSAWVGGDDLVTRELFPTIAYGHKMLEFEKIKEANKVLFVDTEALITKYYLGLLEGMADPLYDEIAKHQQYDLTLLLRPDAVWVDDGLRRHGEERERWENHKKLKKILEDSGVDYVELGGTYESIYREAKKLVTALLEAK